MKAKTLYDFREDYEVFSGTDLHEFFRANTPDGDPSPSGEVEINEVAATNFVVAECCRMAFNSPSLKDHAKAAWEYWATETLE